MIDLYLSHEPPIVSEEIFVFITNALYGRNCELNDEICRKYTSWHDELYRVINGLVL